MLSFYPRDVLDEIWELLSQFLRVFLPTYSTLFVQNYLFINIKYLWYYNLRNVPLFKMMKRIGHKIAIKFSFPLCNML